ncbi:hypothetical protein PIB30_064108 [Stylosanthes scabra]|uniref:Uncharacterized protein n=1 Tax=Stylosanthes scabra TaxID=79078 RepID=A0ABU6RLQ9_9FABA|nr:hypothetical protein [Stylosanthes scabra]
MAKDWMDLPRHSTQYINGMCQRNKKNKEQQKFPHWMGPVNFARVRAAMRKSKGTNEEPQRFEVFIATRTSRKRKELDKGTQTSIEIFRSRQASVESEEEAFRSIFGKEQPGRVRCYGRSVTQSDLQRHSEISALKQQHREEVTTLKSELGDMKTQQQLQAEEIQGLRSMVKLLMLRSEPDMRPEEVDAMMQHGQHSPIGSWLSSCSRCVYVLNKLALSLDIFVLIYSSFITAGAGTLELLLPFLCF